MQPYLQGCGFDITGQFSGQETVYRKDDLIVFMFADEESVLINPANKKTFNATGDSLAVNKSSADGHEVTVTADGPTLHFGPFRLPGQTKRHDGILFTTGRVTLQRHNVGTESEWIAFTKIEGPRTDVCEALAD